MQHNLSHRIVSVCGLVCHNTHCGMCSTSHIWIWCSLYTVDCRLHTVGCVQFLGFHLTTLLVQGSLSWAHRPGTSVFLCWGSAHNCLVIELKILIHCRYSALGHLQYYCRNWLRIGATLFSPGRFSMLRMWSNVPDVSFSKAWKVFLIHKKVRSVAHERVLLQYFGQVDGNSMHFSQKAGSNWMTFDSETS